METVIGLDDTDASDVGMCTTYVASVIADELSDAGFDIIDRYLIRLNPAVTYKTRGNAAVAIRTDAPADAAFETARAHVEALAVMDDPSTNPGLAVVDVTRADGLAEHAWQTVRSIVDPDLAGDRLEHVDALTWTGGNGRGLVGAAAAIGGLTAFNDWTVEYIGYRPRSRYGMPRRVDADSAFAADRATYPYTWDTVDHGEQSVICTPRTPGPVLFGLRGEDAPEVAKAARILDHEPLEREAMFHTNQGTDMHLRPGTPGGVDDGRAYCVSGRVDEEIETRRGGHVHFSIIGGDGRLPCVAFEPTKRFRDHVRRLRPGDYVTVCGEVSEGTLKLEKFAIHSRRSFRRSIPRCEDCDRSMKSAGSGQGYRCPTCDRTANGRVIEVQSREIEPGWYEVPPVARRHLARPLCRGGYPGDRHPER